MLLKVTATNSHKTDKLKICWYQHKINPVVREYMVLSLSYECNITKEYITIHDSMLSLYMILHSFCSWSCN